ncbi:glycosyltransferase [Dyella soli]|uniref:Glycosyltransferase n=1 Tax=Dyella soli TaxID=522319 RepID=A0A4R0YPR2_9GAMM|nr:glycosyltransferase [Dyella soli]TCI10949.1 glycosyltransferase [Dyella soli]
MRDTLLIVTTSFPQAGDGSEAAGAFVADVASELAARVPVRVVAPGERAGVDAPMGAVQVRRFTSPGRPLSLLSPLRVTDWPAIVGTLGSLRAETLAASGDGRVAHVLAFWALPSGWAALEASRRHGVPYSVWALGSDIWTLGKTPIVRSVLRKVIRNASHRFADGLRLGQDAESISGCPFEFLPSTRRLDQVRTRPLASAPPYRLLFLGRWHPNKGVDLLLEAMAELDEGSWSRIAEVHIAGGGPLEGLVRDRVEALQGMGRPIRLSGFLDRDEAAHALGEADFLLLPSRIESIPVVFSDAMKMQLPVISMPVGDLPHLMAEHHVGVVANSVDSRSYAEAIRSALGEAPERMRSAMLDCGKRFSMDANKLCRTLGLVDSSTQENA